MLDALIEVFPQLDFLTLVEVCMEYKDTIDGAADYIIHTVLPSIQDDNNANANDDSHMKGPSSVDNDANSVQSDTYEEKDSLMSGNSNCLVAGSPNLKPEASSFEDDLEIQDDGELAEEDSLMRENKDNHMGENSDCLVAGSLNPKPETSAFEDDLAAQSVYPIRLESLDNAIVNEKDKKVILMSNVTAINQMLEDIKFKEEKAKQAMVDSTKAGNDILVKVEDLKEMTMLAMEDNNKVEGEVFAEQSVLASEAHGLQARLSNISEESNNYFLIIDEMHNTLQGRLAAAELETVLSKQAKIDRESLAMKMLNEQELLVDATKERSKKLEEQVQENTKLKELLMDRGQVVDALQGEMLGIFDKISQLQLRVQGSSSRSCSSNPADNIAQPQCEVDEGQNSADELLQIASPSSFRSTDSTAQALDHEAQLPPVDEPLLLPADESEPLQQHYPDDDDDEPQVPLDVPLQLGSSSSLKSSDSSIAELLGRRVLDVHLAVGSAQLASSGLVKSSDNIAPFRYRTSVDVDDSPQLPSYCLASSEKLTASKSSWSSAVRSNSVISANDETDDDSWDVVDDEAMYMCAN
uniref:CUE domain-containing protein n=2 Tax=Oryza brachyantha TaxID=4533 RepID=J3M4F7_ORYBR